MASATVAPVGLPSPAPFAAAALILAAASSAGAQPAAVTLEAPLQQLGERFFERIGTGLAVHGNGWFFNWDGRNAAVPPGGGWDPGTDAWFGLRGRAGGLQYGLGAAAGQGSQRSLSVQSPLVTFLNGSPAGLWHGAVRPFVTGLVPIVGGQRWASPIQERLARLRQAVLAGRAASTTAGARRSEPRPDAAEAPREERRRSTAEQGDVSLAEIQAELAAQRAARRREAQRLAARGDAALARGQANVANIYYRQALARAEPPLRKQLLAKLRALAPPAADGRR